LRWVEGWLLRHEGNAQVLLHVHGAVVWFLQTPQDLEQRRFARAIAADQADTLGRFQGEVGFVEEGDVPKSQLSVE
jgi:hypothetical protein